MPPERNILRYSRRSRVFHWLHSLAFVILLLTGLARLLHHNPSTAFHAVIIVHMAAAVLFTGLPLVYYLIWPRQVVEFVKGVFQWRPSDLQWLKAAPAYYFGGSQDKMPAQGWINPGQRAWELALISSGLIFILTGIPLWFFKFRIPLAAYEWALSIHAVVFFGIFIFFLVHVYLGVLHPLFKESWRSMLDGHISAHYAKTHYRRWFEKEKREK